MDAPLGCGRHSSGLLRRGAHPDAVHSVAGKDDGGARQRGDRDLARHRVPRARGRRRHLIHRARRRLRHAPRATDHTAACGGPSYTGCTRDFGCPRMGIRRAASAKADTLVCCRLRCWCARQGAARPVEDGQAGGSQVGDTMRRERHPARRPWGCRERCRVSAAAPCPAWTACAARRRGRARAPRPGRARAPR